MSCNRKFLPFSLNYHIVDSDIIATRLVKEFNNARQRGEIHFLPLNVLEVSTNTLSHINGASPLIDQIQWVPKVERAVRHVFNRIMLCEDFNTATRTARQYDVDCVTLDGKKKEIDIYVSMNINFAFYR